MLMDPTLFFDMFYVEANEERELLGTAMGANIGIIFLYFM